MAARCRATAKRWRHCPASGRKTANVVLNTAFGEPTIAVDTHIFRVANRTGLAPGKTPRAVEDQLLERAPDGIPARRAPLADPARPLRLQGARPDCAALRDRALVRVSRQGAGMSRARIAGLYRYPLKSARGQACAAPGCATPGSSTTASGWSSMPPAASSRSANGRSWPRSHVRLEGGVTDLRRLGTRAALPQAFAGTPAACASGAMNAPPSMPEPPPPRGCRRGSAAPTAWCASTAPAALQQSRVDRRPGCAHAVQGRLSVAGARPGLAR